MQNVSIATKENGLCDREILICKFLVFIAVPCITDCVLAELEKLGPKYRIALK